ncbi:membrane dipeptidase [bacterium]|nr:membrane dipeptidase [bacterium]
MIPAWDLHCDSLTKAGERGLGTNPALQWDLERFMAGGGELQVHAIFTPPEMRGGDATLHALGHAQGWERFLREEGVAGVRSKADLATPGPKSLLSLEDAAPLAGELGLVDLFFAAGVRLVTLVWSCDNKVGRGVTGEGPVLTPFGEELIAALEERGVAVDLSHASEEMFTAALAVCDRPPICTHSNCRALRDHPRNLTDDQIRRLAAAGGLMGLAYVPNFVASPPAGEPEWEFALLAGAARLAEHARHAANLVGAQRLALGGDLDGTTNPVIAHAGLMQEMAIALEGVGFSTDEVALVMHGNAKRYLQGSLPA